MTRWDPSHGTDADSGAGIGRDAFASVDDPGGDVDERPTNISADNYRGEFISSRLEATDR